MRLAKATPRMAYALGVYQEVETSSLQSIQILYAVPSGIMQSGRLRGRVYGAIDARAVTVRKQGDLGKGDPRHVADAF